MHNAEIAINIILVVLLLLLLQLPICCEAPRWISLQTNKTLQQQQQQQGERVGRAWFSANMGSLISITKCFHFFVVVIVVAILAVVFYDYDQCNEDSG